MNGRKVWLRSAAIGILLGVAWGVASRGWMRLIAVHPDFTWTGTLAIVGFAGVAGLSLGLVHAARLRRGSRAWRGAALPSLLLFAGPGMVLLPAYVLGGWALASRRRLGLRFAAVVVPVIVPVLLWRDLDAYDRIVISPWVFIGGFAGLSIALAMAGSEVARPWSTRAQDREVSATLVA